MTTPSPAPSPSQCQVSGPGLLQLVDTLFYRGCSQDTANPICAAVQKVASDSKSDLSDLAKALKSIDPKDIENYFQGPGNQMVARMIPIVNVAKCLLVPGKGEGSAYRKQYNAIATIREWYMSTYLKALTKVPNFPLTEHDVKQIHTSVQEMSCSPSLKNMLQNWEFWVAILVVILLTAVVTCKLCHRAKSM